MGECGSDSRNVGVWESVVVIFGCEMMGEMCDSDSRNVGVWDDVC